MRYFDIPAKVSRPWSVTMTPRKQVKLESRLQIKNDQKYKQNDHFNFQCIMETLVDINHPETIYTSIEIAHNLIIIYRIHLGINPII